MTNDRVSESGLVLNLRAAVCAFWRISADIRKVERERCGCSRAEVGPSIEVRCEGGMRLSPVTVFTRKWSCLFEASILPNRWWIVGSASTDRHLACIGRLGCLPGGFGFFVRISFLTLFENIKKSLRDSEKRRSFRMDIARI